MRMPRSFAHRFGLPNVPGVRETLGVLRLMWFDVSLSLSGLYRRGGPFTGGTCSSTPTRRHANYNAAAQVSSRSAVARASRRSPSPPRPPARCVGGATYTADRHRHLGPRRHPDRRPLDGRRLHHHRRRRLLHRDRQLHHRRQPGRQRRLPGGHPGPADLRGGQGLPRPSPSPRPPPSAAVGSPTYTPTATGGPRATRSPSPSTAPRRSACSIAGATVSFTGAGSCVIDANQAGNTNYNAATQVQQTVTVTKANQTITFTSTAPGQRGGGRGHLHAERHRRRLGQPGDLHHRRLRPRRSARSPAASVSFRRRQLRHRRQPGRQRQLQRRHPGPADLRGRQGRPDGHLHLDSADQCHRQRGQLHADGHRLLGPDPGDHRRRLGLLGLLDHGRRRQLRRRPAPASSTPTRPATPTTTPPPRCSRASRWPRPARR